MSQGKDVLVQQAALQGPHPPLLSQAVPHSLLLLQGSHGQAQVLLQLLNLFLRPSLDVVQLHVHVLVLSREALVLGPATEEHCGHEPTTPTPCHTSTLPPAGST